MNELKKLLGLSGLLLLSMGVASVSFAEDDSGLGKSVMFGNDRVDIPQKDPMDFSDTPQDARCQELSAKMEEKRYRPQQRLMYKEAYTVECLSMGAAQKDVGFGVGMDDNWLQLY